MGLRPGCNACDLKAGQVLRTMPTSKACRSKTRPSACTCMLRYRLPRYTSEMSGWEGGLQTRRSPRTRTHITLRKPKKIIKENMFRYKPLGLAIKPTAKLCFSACKTVLCALHLQSCDFRAGAQNLYFACYTCTSKLRSSSQSWKLVLHVLYLHYKVVTFQLVAILQLAGTTKL